jgi:AcrR family transcriptional regulator
VSADEGRVETPDASPGRTRRPSGEPRRLLLQAARKAFNDQGYPDATTREIAQQADVSETLLFRYFGSKTELFREAMVVPFLDFVASFADNARRMTEVELDRSPSDDEISKNFLGELYDLFCSHRALAIMFFASDVHTQSDLAESGVFDEVGAALERLVEIGQGEMQRRGLALPRQDVSTRTTIAMVACMAAFGTWFFGSTPSTRDDVVDELTQAVMHGHNHRARGSRRRIGST